MDLRLIIKLKQMFYHLPASAPCISSFSSVVVDESSASTILCPPSPLHTHTYHYSKTVHQHSPLLHCKIYSLLWINASGNPISLNDFLKRPETSWSHLPFQQLFHISAPLYSHSLDNLCSVSNSLLTFSSSFCPQLHQNCSSQGHQWLHLTNSIVFILLT